MRLSLNLLATALLAATLAVLSLNASPGGPPANQSGVPAWLLSAEPRRAGSLYTTPTFWIIDSAEVLTPEQEKRLNRMIAEVNKRTSIQMLGITTQSLQGASIEEYSLRVANGFGVGMEGINNGALIVLAIEDRQVRIELGYGMEWHVTDSMATAIIGDMTTHIRDGRHHDGLEAGFGRIARLTRNVDWKIRYRSIAEVSKAGARALGKIVRFDGRVTELNAPDARIETSEGTSVALQLSPHADLSPTGLQPNTRQSIHARVVSTSPLKLQMLGSRRLE